MEENKNNILSTIFQGKFLIGNKKNFPFVLFLSFLLLLIISIYYNAERLATEIHQTEADLYELRVEYITTKAELMEMHKRSVIEDLVDTLGIATSLIPPKILEQH